MGMTMITRTEVTNALRQLAKIADSVHQLAESTKATNRLLERIGAPPRVMLGTDGAGDGFVAAMNVFEAPRPPDPPLPEVKKGHDAWFVDGVTYDPRVRQGAFLRHRMLRDLAVLRELGDNGPMPMAKVGDAEAYNAAALVAVEDLEKALDTPIPVPRQAILQRLVVIKTALLNGTNR